MKPPAGACSYDSFEACRIIGKQAKIKRTFIWIPFFVSAFDRRNTQRLFLLPVQIQRESSFFISSKCAWVSACKRTVEDFIRSHRLRATCKWWHLLIWILNLWWARRFSDFIATQASKQIRDSSHKWSISWWNFIYTHAPLDFSLDWKCSINIKVYMPIQPFLG